MWFGHYRQPWTIAGSSHQNEQSKAGHCIQSHTITHLPNDRNRSEMTHLGKSLSDVCQKCVMNKDDFWLLGVSGSHSLAEYINLLELAAVSRGGDEMMACGKVLCQRVKHLFASHVQSELKTFENKMFDNHSSPNLSAPSFLQPMFIFLRAKQFGNTAAHWRVEQSFWNKIEYIARHATSGDFDMPRHIMIVEWVALIVRSWVTVGTLSCWDEWKSKRCKALVGKRLFLLPGTRPFRSIFPNFVEPQVLIVCQIQW